MDKRKTNILLALLIIVVVLVMTVINPPDSVYFQLVEDVICVDGPEEFRYEFPLAEVEQMTLEEDPVYGDGTKAKGVVWGEYTNDRWGEHTQCVYAKVPVCIVVTGQGETFVFNVENEETTRSLHEALLEYMEEEM